MPVQTLTIRLIKKIFGTLAIMSVISVSIPMASAATPALGSQNSHYLNLGTVDIQTIPKEGVLNRDWFVEYLQPTQETEEQIRIANFSNEEKKLSLSVRGAENDQNHHFVQSEDEAVQNVANWVTLPVQNITLKAGESKVLSVHFKIPDHAGVGLHTGAIMIGEIVDTAQATNQIVIEKGIRVYLNVKGSMVTKANITSTTVKSNGENSAVEMKILNSGTTDYTTNLQAQALNIYDEPISTAEQKATIHPGEEKTVTINIQKPAFGIYKIKTTSELGNTTSGAMLAIPLWSIATFMMLAFAVFIATFYVKKSPLQELLMEKFRDLSDSISLGNFFASFKILNFQKSFAFLGIFLFAVVITFSANGSESRGLKAQLLDIPTSSTYMLTMKWGNFRDMILPPNYRKNWDGEINFHNAKVYLSELKNFEPNDSAEITNNNTSLFFRNETGPDNDGVILKIESTSSEMPTFTYINHTTQQKTELSMADIVNASAIIPDTIFGTYLSAESSSDHPNTLALEAQTTKEIQSTEEPTSTPGPVLGNLFQELPATAEQLADVIYNSDYVQRTSIENSVHRAQTDPILIKALQGTPEIIQEITPTPDLNFMFIPTGSIRFPTQTFSFQDEKITDGNLGTLIFVQNKQAPWNTYVTVSNLISLSGKGIIPASALTIHPGEINMISSGDGNITPGPSHTLQGSSDEAILVSVQPSGNGKTIFTLNPNFEIRIPAKTTPGRYRGTLTIVSL